MNIENNEIKEIKINNKKITLMKPIYKSTLYHINKINIPKNGKKFQGAFSQVYPFEHGKQNYILKIINDPNKKEIKGIEFHRDLQKKLNNNEREYFCYLIEYGMIKEEPHKFYVIMEDCFKELNNYIDTLTKRTNIDLKNYQSLLIDCVKSIQIIHKYDYLHLDIKPENFLVDVYIYENNIKKKNIITQLKVIDFGFVKKINTEAKSVFGTMLYIDMDWIIEIIKGNSYILTIQTDIYSLGINFIMLHFIFHLKVNGYNLLQPLLIFKQSLFKQSLFRQNNVNKVIQQVKNKYLEQVKNKYLKLINNILNKIQNLDFRRIIKKCLRIEESYESTQELIHELEKLFYNS